MVEEGRVAHRLRFLASVGVPMRKRTIKADSPKVWAFIGGESLARTSPLLGNSMTLAASTAGSA